jgi:hypothetical protein
MPKKTDQAACHLLNQDDQEHLMCGSSRISREDSPCVDGPLGLDDAAFVDLFWSKVGSGSMSRGARGPSAMES